MYHLPHVCTARDGNENICDVRKLNFCLWVTVNIIHQEELQPSIIEVFQLHKGTIVLIVTDKITYRPDNNRFGNGYLASLSSACVNQNDKKNMNHITSVILATESKVYLKIYSHKTKFF